MNGSAVETFLASIYVDCEARARFVADPSGEARRAGLSSEECASLSNLDWNGLQLMARSLAHKRQAKQGVRKSSVPKWIWQSVLNAFHLFR
jgi:hypothetical protein